jgi:alcohol dehydrogenase class IV
MGPHTDNAGERSSAFVAPMEKLMNESGAPRRLGDAGVTDNTLSMFATDTRSRLSMSNPVDVTEADALALYREAF